MPAETVHSSIHLQSLTCQQTPPPPTMSRTAPLLRHGQCLLHNTTTNKPTLFTPIRHSFSPLGSPCLLHRQQKKHHFSLQTYLPILTPTFWKQIIPRFLRREPTPTTTAAANNRPQTPARTRVWNPATWYVVIFFIIGSEAIQLIAERHTREDQVRKSEIRIRLLKELVESVQNGTLDKNLTAQELKKRLLAGTPTQEREWEEVLEEIERDNSQWQEQMKNQKKEKEEQMAKFGAQQQQQQERQDDDSENTPRQYIDMQPRKPKSGTKIY